MSAKLRTWKQRLASAFGTLFGLVFVVGGLGAGAFFGAGLLDWVDARDWQEVDAGAVESIRAEKSAAVGHRRYFRLRLR